jgi:GNAT superfamily N-acetyltransferase
LTAPRETIVVVRRARPDDVATVVGIHERSSRHAYSHMFPPDAPFPTFDEMAARWRPALVDDGASVAFIAEVEGCAVGGVIADSHSARGLGNLRHLYVEPHAWGSGAGRALHDAAVNWCAGVVVDEMDLWVLEENRRARDMYERWGWAVDPDERLVHDGLDVTEVRYVLAMVPRS